MTTYHVLDRGRTGDAAEKALDRAVDHLLGQQDRQGWWKGELETNVTIDAEDLLLREFLGVRTPEQTEETARWIRSRQSDDGSWALFYCGPGDVSTTVEAYVALRLAGDEPGAVHMERARQFVLAHGGVEGTRVFTRIWLALFGTWPWEDVPALPPEMLLLPTWVPLNIYDFACWARQTLVALTIVRALRPARPLGFGIDELRSGRQPATSPRTVPARVLDRLDRLLRAYERRPIGPLRRYALRRAAGWVLARQEADGSWGGIQPPWVYSLIALHLLGYRLDHPAMRRGLDGLERFTIREQIGAPGRGPGTDAVVRRLEACQSPTWDAALAIIALHDAGVAGDHPAVLRGVRWLLGEEIGVRGDWAVRRPGLAPGGWAFEFDNDGYPDTDDTAEVIMALRRLDPAVPDARAVDAAVRRGVRWLEGMQSRDGGWGAFDADNTSRLCTELPFCDFGAVTDPPSADVTAHIVEALAREGRSTSPAVRRGVAWLLRTQEPNGSWFGRWGANHIYGTGAVLPALVAAGISPRAPAIRRAIAWLESVQNADGGWGEDLRSYDDPTWIGRGASTASQTAWALLALHAVDRAGDTDGTAVQRGTDWLVAQQRPDGSWDEPFYTGTGFPGDFYLNYHLYRLVFPISALGRILGRRKPCQVR